MKTDDTLLGFLVGLAILALFYGWIEERLGPKPATPPVVPTPTNELLYEIWWGDDATNYQVPKVAEFKAKTRSGHQYVLIHSTNCPCLKPERE
jgi:hypothetical protein